MTDGRSQEEQENLNRRWLELLNELRVALPGVQVLFAFLLAVPFQQGFQRIDDFQRTMYFVTLLLAAASSACLIAPGAYHRILFRQKEKPNIIEVSSRFALAGLVFLALAMNAAILLVTDLIYQRDTVVITVAITTSAFAWLWFGLGLMRRLQQRHAGGRDLDVPGVGDTP
jgi:hypothetical protein